VEVKLKVLSGPHQGKEIPLQESKFLIGRSEDCHLRPNSDMISRHHCVIMVDGSYIEIRDFGSKNGTYVNGERVSTARELRPGDTLRAGPLEFEVVVLQRVGGKKRSPVKDVADVAVRTADRVSSSDNEDIEDWLAVSDEEAQQTSSGNNPLRETQAIGVGDTGIIPTSTTDASDTKDTPPADADAKTGSEDESPERSKSSSRSKGKKKPGKLPPLPTRNLKDSSNAAADILRRMRRR
jgi:pSer/pThr/pTyr-binding forkhead associated (FHA) protein